MNIVLRVSSCHLVCRIETSIIGLQKSIKCVALNHLFCKSKIDNIVDFTNYSKSFWLHVVKFKESLTRLK